VIKETTPSRYLDDAFGQGINVVLLHLGDEMYQEALGPYVQAAQRFEGSRWVNLWVCCIQSDDDCVAVQACRFPQFRFLVNGVEKSSHLGALEAREIVQTIFSMEDHQ